MTTPQSDAHVPQTVHVIEPGRGGLRPHLKELWEYRGLFWVLATRDIQIRYKQTLLGAGWAIIVPLMTMVVFTVLFQLLSGARPVTSGTPYAVTMFCALLPWQLFASGVGSAGNSIVNAGGMIKKVYFPRLIVPAAAMLTALVDFSITFGVLVLMLAGYHLAGAIHFTFTWHLLLLPLFIALAVGAALSVGLWLAALNATWRDVKYVIPFFVQLGMYVSPVILEAGAITGKIPEALRPLYFLNPMAGVIEGFRWSLLPNYPHPPVAMLCLSALVVAVVGVSGLWFFHRSERSFIDLL